MKLSLRYQANAAAAAISKLENDFHNTSARLLKAASRGAAQATGARQPTPAQLEAIADLHARGLFQIALCRPSTMAEMEAAAWAMGEASVYEVLGHG